MTPRYVQIDPRGLRNPLFLSSYTNMCLVAHGTQSTALTRQLNPNMAEVLSKDDKLTHYGIVLGGLRLLDRLRERYQCRLLVPYV